MLKGMNAIRRTFLNLIETTLLFLLFLFFNPLTLWSQNNAKSNSFLQIIQKEVAENFKTLKQKDNNLSLITYRIDEIHHYQALATFGTVVAENQSSVRRLTVCLFINNIGNSYSEEREVFLPIEDGEEAITQIIKNETQIAYQNALQKYETSTLQSFYISENQKFKIVNYAAQNHYEEPLTFTIDGEKWKRKLRKYSLNFKPYESVIKGSASLDFSYVRKYFVSSEGASIVQNNLYSYLNISVLGYADDGLEIPLEKSWFSFLPEELPSDDRILEETIQMLELFQLLQNAPVVETVPAPALLSDEVSAAWLLVNAVPNIIANEGLDFDNLNSLSKEINLIADPTIKYFEDFPLSGSYIYDDEGVMSEKVELILDGKRENSLQSRLVSHAEMTNAHARAHSGYAPVARPSNIRFFSTSPCTETELHNLFLQELKKQQKPFGYRLKSVKSRVVESHSRYFTISPMLVYKVYADGTPDELVRGAVWSGDLVDVLKNMVAVGKTSKFYAFRCDGQSGEISVSVAAPAMLLSQVTLRPFSYTPQKILQTRPYQDVDNLTDFDEVAFKAMQEELQRNRLNLSTSGLPAPQRIAYVITDAKVTSAKASLGAVIYANEKPQRGAYSEVIIGNRDWNTYSCTTLDTINNVTELLPLPLDNNYSAIRSALWLLTENRYKIANRLWLKKNQYYLDDGVFIKPHNDKELSKITSSMMSVENLYGSLDPSVIRNCTRELSKVFVSYPALTSSFVESYAVEAEILSLSSDGVQYKQPQQLLCVRAYAEIIADDGEKLSDVQNFYFRSTSQLTELNEIETVLHAMANNLTQLRSAPILETAYNGPILFGQEVVGEIFYHNFLKENELIFARRQTIMNGDSLVSWKNPMESADFNHRYFSKYFSLSTDDYLNSFDNQLLVGDFFLDADGTSPIAEMDIIKKGRFNRLLSNRLRTISSKESSGHQRLMYNGKYFEPALAPGVLKLETKGLSLNRLRSKAKREAKRAGYDYYYEVVKLKENSLEPLLLYRVSLKGGETTLVRTATTNMPEINDYKENIIFSSSKRAYNKMFEPFDMQVKETTLLNGVPCSFILPEAFLYLEGAVLKKRFLPIFPSSFPKNNN